ncbi:hypothetical protein FOL46_003023, partial [Perkinsus olseni]
GASCHFSHDGAALCKPSVVNPPQRITSAYDAHRFLRRLDDGNDIDAQLCAIYSVRDKLREYVSDLGPNELALTVGLLEPLKDAFDNEKFTEVLRALSANLIVATSAGYVDEINSEARFMGYLGLLVQICRAYPRCMGLVPMVSVKARAAQVIKKHDHQAHIYIQQIEFYLAGGSGNKAHQRGRSANRVHLTEAESEECEALMREENLLPTLDGISDRHSGSTLRPKLVNRLTDCWDAGKKEDLLLYRAMHYHCLRQEFLLPLKEALRPVMGMAPAGCEGGRPACYEHVSASRTPFGVSNTGDPYVEGKVDRPCASQGVMLSVLQVKRMGVP